MTSPTIQLAKALIEKPSITPDDAGCQTLIAEHLKQLRFNIQPVNHGNVSNLWACYGNTAPLFIFAGHTDVVPAGDLSKWLSDPFSPEIRDGKLYGRGASDMKGALAAMLVATEEFLKNNPNPKGSIGFLITSDEEGDAINGTAKVVEYLQANNIKPDYCVIGEASSEEKLGDAIKVGRRGSLNGKLTIFGKQGHIAYAYLADNPIQKISPILEALHQIQWDNAGGKLPATTFQISNLHAGTGAENVIPETVEIIFNFRFSDQVTADELKQKVTDILEKEPVKYQLNWKPESQPFYAKQGDLIELAQEAIQAITGLKAKLSSGGGTSDGRFIAKLDTQLIELGVCNDSIHQMNEHVSVRDLNQLTEIYQRLLESIF